MKTLILAIALLFLSGCESTPSQDGQPQQSRINYLVNEFGRQYCMADELGRQIIRQKLNERLNGFEIKLICQDDYFTIRYI